MKLLPEKDHTGKTDSKVNKGLQLIHSMRDYTYYSVSTLICFHRGVTESNFGLSCQEQTGKMNENSVIIYLSSKKDGNTQIKLARFL